MTCTDVVMAAARFVMALHTCSPAAAGPWLYLRGGWERREREKQSRARHEVS